MTALHEFGFSISLDFNIFFSIRIVNYTLQPDFTMHICAQNVSWEYICTQVKNSVHKQQNLRKHIDLRPVIQTGKNFTSNRSQTVKNV